MLSTKILVVLSGLSTILALPVPHPAPDGACVGSSFSPTNCDSPGAQSIDVSPDLNVAPSVDLGNVLRERESRSSGGACVGSSFSPTNCDSPGAQSVNVDPSVDVSPTVSIGGSGEDN